MNMHTKLTPYDTGERLEPKLWVGGSAGVTKDNRDDFGKVDFEDDESATVATVWFAKRGDGRYSLCVDGAGGEVFDVEQSGDRRVLQVVTDPLPQDHILILHELVASADEDGARVEFTQAINRMQLSCEVRFPDGTRTVETLDLQPAAVAVGHRDHE